MHLPIPIHPSAIHNPSQSTPTNAILQQVAIIFYSTYGHAKTLAEAIQQGVAEAGGEPMLYQV